MAVKNNFVDSTSRDEQCFTYKLRKYHNCNNLLGKHALGERLVTLEATN